MAMHPVFARPRQERRAFTLVELLIVVAIIAVLAGVLLPSANAALDKARRTECASNERQIWMGMQSYATDHDGSLPITGTAPWGEENTWGYSIWPYIYGGLTTFKYPQNCLQMGTPSYAGLQKNVFHCPATKAKAVNVPGASNPNKARFSYGLNADPNGLSYNRNVPLYPRRLPHPELTALVTETSDSPGDYAGYLQQCGLIPHNGGSNILFVDGHVEWRKLAAIPASSTDVFWTGVVK